MKAYGKYCFEWILAFPLTVAFLLISPQDLGIPSVGFGTCLYAAIACTAFASIRYLKGRDRLIAIGAVAAFLGLPAAYGLLNLAPDSSSPLHRWTVGMDFHLNL